MAGTLVSSTLSDGTNSTSTTNAIQGSAKAWVNFNGSGGATIRASYNVSSVTRNSTGNYTMNFATAMPDANSCVVVSKQNWLSYTNSISNTNCNVITAAYNTIANDEPIMSIAVFR